MKNLWLLVLCGFLVGTLLSNTRSARAVDAFKKEFIAKYVKTEPATETEKAFAASVKKVNCNVCHVGKSKKERNEYGKALDELLDKKADVKNVEKIREALDTVAAKKSDPNNPSSPTFGELIQQGKLPGGDEQPAAASAE